MRNWPVLTCKRLATVRFKVGDNTDRKRCSFVRRLRLTAIPAATLTVPARPFSGVGTNQMTFMLPSLLFRFDDLLRLASSTASVYLLGYPKDVVTLAVSGALVAEETHRFLDPGFGDGEMSETVVVKRHYSACFRLVLISGNIRGMLSTHRRRVGIGHLPDLGAGRCCCLDSGSVPEMHRNSGLF
jgi:hypothetical protein